MQILSAKQALVTFPEAKFCNSIKNRKSIAKTFCANSYGGSHFGRTKSPDVIVVGAGVAGSALAHTLGKDGLRVHVIERNLNVPDKLAGELLQPAGYQTLIELGLADCVTGIDAQVALGYAFCKDGKSIKIPFPLEKYESDVAGRTFHHGRFVQKMRRKAASLPNVKLEQGTATSLIQEGGAVKGILYKTSNGQESRACAPLTIVCDGCFSRLRRFLAKPKVVKPSHCVGLIVENCRIPYPNYAHLIMANPSSVVCYRISSTEVRFLIDFPGQELPSISNGQMARYLKTMVAPKLPPELLSPFLLSVDKGSSIRAMPDNCMPAAPCLTPGALILGDALNTRHALGGGGMTVALHDISLLANLLRSLDLENTAMVKKFAAQFYDIRKQKAFNLNVMANTTYKMVNATPDEIKEDVLEACFNYLSNGSVLSGGFVELLSGLNPQPWTLLRHLFPAAAYILGSMFVPIPSPSRINAAAQFATVAGSVFMTILLDEWQSGVISNARAAEKSKDNNIERNRSLK